MNPRKRRRVRRRIRRALTTLTVLAVGATAVLTFGPGNDPVSAASSSQYHATAQESIADVQAFWTATLPSVYGRKYTPIPDSRQYPYSSSKPPPACGGRGTTPYQQVAGNAFYCDQSDFIAWDDQQLIPQLRKQFGDFAVGLVLAHEFGHAIQTRVGFQTDASIYVELQADCFAGAWARHIAAGDNTSLALSNDDLDHALAGFLQLRDPSGVDGGQDGAHGNAFDRVGAFQDGLDGGAATCKGYASNPPDVTESGFTSSADQAVNGDLPLNQVLPMLKTSLDDYWSGAVKSYGQAPKLVADTSKNAASCNGSSDGGVLSDTVTYCAGTDTITYSSATLDQAEQKIGDLGAGVYVAAAWSSAVQHRLGNTLGTGKARAAADCLTGAWAGAVQNGNVSTRTRNFSFSPGDLDEVVATFVASTNQKSSAERGTAFSRVTAFRSGFEHGTSSCVKSTSSGSSGSSTSKSSGLV